MFKLLNLICALLLTFVTISEVKAQDLEQVARAPVLTTNGGVSFSQIGNFSPDSSVVQDNYSYYLSGNINFNFFGVVNAPFSFAYTNNEVTSQLPQPFNRLSISPSYKWITTHIGYSSMSFSPYTLSGHEFLGGGVELSPGEKFKMSAMYGRMKKAVLTDSLGSEPSFHRMGGGLKLDYLNKNIDFSVNLFKAKDDMNSLPVAMLDTFMVKPADNLTGSAIVNIKLANGFSFMAEYALSAMNYDISRADSLGGSSDNYFFESRGDVSVYYAFKSSVSQSSKLGKIGATYEIVSPNYNTLGAYYFTNDFENITANFSTSIKKRINIALDAGYQYDNLDEQKTNSTSRMIYSANVSALLSKKITVGASLSNLQSYVHIRDIYDELDDTNEFENIDTLSFTQLNITESVNLNYLIRSTKQQRQNLTVSFTYQEASEQQSDDQKFTGNQIYNSLLSYQFSLIPQRFNASLSVNHNQNRLVDNKMNIVSYNLSLQKVFKDKIKTAVISTYSNSTNDTVTIADVINVRVTGGYTLKKRHSINLSLVMVNNKSMQGDKIQLAVNLAYNYMFNFIAKREQKNLKFEGGF